MFERVCDPQKTWAIWVGYQGVSGSRSHLNPQPEAPVRSRSGPDSNKNIRVGRIGRYGQDSLLVSQSTEAARQSGASQGDSGV